MVFYIIAVLCVSRAELKGAGTRRHTLAQRVGSVLWGGRTLGLVAYARADVFRAIVPANVIPTRILGGGHVNEAAFTERECMCTLLVCTVRALVSPRANLRGGVACSLPRPP